MPISAGPKPSDAIAPRNRANARHSTGPHTAASRNTVPHGLLSIHSLAVGASAQAAARRCESPGADRTVQADTGGDCAQAAMYVLRSAASSAFLHGPPHATHDSHVFLGLLFYCAMLSTSWCDTRSHREAHGSHRTNGTRYPITGPWGAVQEKWLQMVANGREWS
jgi:hypothetical protein